MKTLDIIVKQPFAPHKPHADLLLLGYKFLCSHVSISAFTDSDIEIDTDNHEVVAVKQEQGFNFYSKEKQ